MLEHSIVREVVGLPSVTTPRAGGHQRQGPYHRLASHKATIAANHYVTTPGTWGSQAGINVDWILARW